MFKTSTAILLLLIGISVVIGVLYWLVTTPKKPMLQPSLEERTDFSYSTPLLIEQDSSLNRPLLLRRVRDSDWRMSSNRMRT